MTNLASTCISVAFIRSSRPEVFLEKGVLKICSKFTGEHSYRSAILIKLLCISVALINLLPSNFPAGNSMFKFSKGNTRTRCEFHTFF